jgi:hypothetical protein
MAMAEPPETALPRTAAPSHILRRDPRGSDARGCRTRLNGARLGPRVRRSLVALNSTSALYHRGTGPGPQRNEAARPLNDLSPSPVPTTRSAFCPTRTVVVRVKGPWIGAITGIALKVAKVTGSES